MICSRSSLYLIAVCLSWYLFFFSSFLCPSFFNLSPSSLFVIYWLVYLCPRVGLLWFGLFVFFFFFGGGVVPLRQGRIRTAVIYVRFLGTVFRLSGAVVGLFYAHVSFTSILCGGEICEGWIVRLGSDRGRWKWWDVHLIWCYQVWFWEMQSLVRYRFIWKLWRIMGCETGDSMKKHPYFNA